MTKADKKNISNLVFLNILAVIIWFFIDKENIYFPLTFLMATSFLAALTCRAE